jgi:hypothetical protein
MKRPVFRVCVCVFVCVYIYTHKIYIYIYTRARFLRPEDRTNVSHHIRSMTFGPIQSHRKGHLYELNKAWRACLYTSCHNMIFFSPEIQFSAYLSYIVTRANIRLSKRIMREHPYICHTISGDGWTSVRHALHAVRRDQVARRATPLERRFVLLSGNLRTLFALSLYCLCGYWVR